MTINKNIELDEQARLEAMQFLIANGAADYLGRARVEQYFKKHGLTSGERLRQEIRWMDEVLATLESDRQNFFNTTKNSGVQIRRVWEKILAQRNDLHALERWFGPLWFSEVRAAYGLKVRLEHQATLEEESKNWMVELVDHVLRGKTFWISTKAETIAAIKDLLGDDSAFQAFERLLYDASLIKKEARKLFEDCECKRAVAGQQASPELKEEAIAAYKVFCAAGRQELLDRVGQRAAS